MFIIHSGLFVLIYNNPIKLFNNDRKICGIYSLVNDTINNVLVYVIIISNYTEN